MVLPLSALQCHKSPLNLCSSQHSPPMNIISKNKLTSSEPAIKAHAIRDLHTIANKILASSPTALPGKSRLRNHGCMKETDYCRPCEQSHNCPVVIDDHRICHNCGLKFFASKSNTDKCGDFCSDECMWSAIMMLPEPQVSSIETPLHSDWKPNEVSPQKKSGNIFLFVSPLN